MKKEYKDLLNEFKRISRKKWIKSISKSHGSVGNTFENELKKKPDSLYFPDYEGIELKCTTKYSRYPLYLFTLAFDGPTFPEINRLIDLYGYPDKNYPDKKVIFAKIDGKSSTENNYIYKLKTDRESKKIFLEIYNKNGNLVEKKSFVYIQSIYNHLMIKLKSLAIIYSYKKKENNDTYFRYYKLIIYELISFNRFLELLEKGIIKVDLIARMNKSGVDEGRYRNKNLVFSIRKYDIDKLFKTMYEHDADMIENNLDSNFYIMN